MLIVQINIIAKTLAGEYNSVMTINNFGHNINKMRKIKLALSLIMVTVIVTFFSSCSVLDILEFQNEDNTVNGTVELSDRISEEAKDGVEEVTLYVVGATEDDIKNITGNMGLFWGEPTEYTILKADADDDTIKVKFFIKKTNNYYAVKNYIEGAEIPESNKQAPAIVAELKTIIDKIIKDDMSDYDKELAIHDWLVKNVEYVEGLDPSSTENGSYGALVSKRTMCRGYAEAVKVISECCGLNTKLIVGDAVDQNGRTVGHAWNLVNLEDKWYHLDVTYDDPIGDKSKNIHHFYFNLSDTDISKDHTWEKDYFPSCDNDSYMYYKKNDLYYSNYDDFRSEVSDTIKYDKPKFLEVVLDAAKVSESQLRFIFNATSMNSFTWTTHSSNPIIVTIMPNY